MIVLEALRGVRDHHLPYFDAQIWACARLNQVPVVFSEDFNPGFLEGMRFVNPFLLDVDRDLWRRLYPPLASTSGESAHK